MNFKKMISKTLVFTLALGLISFTSPNNTKAAESITFVGTEEKATVEEYTHWGIAKEVDEKKADFKDATTEKHFKVDEVAPVEGGVIDLSFLSKKKANYVAVGKGSNFESGSAWKVLAIPGQNSDFKAAFVQVSADGSKAIFGTTEIDGANVYKAKELGALAVIDKEGNPVNLSTLGKNYEISMGQSGNWTQLNQFFGGSEDAAPAADAQVKAISRLVQTGADAYIRLKGSDTAWNSKAVKVKFTKTAKAPKVVVDTAKGEVKFKKGQEYKLYDAAGATAAATGAWTQADGKKTFAELSIDLTKDLTLEVRDAATAKKTASKVTKIKLTKQTKPSLTALTTSGALIASALNLEMKLPYDIKKGATIINSTKTEYEYAITADGSAPKADHKWVKIKAGKQDKKKPDVTVPAKTSVKYSKDGKANTYTDTNENAKIYVRLAGSKQDKKDGSATLPSEAGDATFKIANETRTLTLNDFAVAAKVKTEKSHNENLTINKLHKAGSKAKIKVTEKLPGVSVKVGNFKNTTAVVTVKVSKSAFKDVPSGGTATLKFKLTHEGAEKEVTVTFNVSK